MLGVGKVMDAARHARSVNNDILEKNILLESLLWCDRVNYFSDKAFSWVDTTLY
jgi:hypothetical protein